MKVKMLFFGEAIGLPKVNIPLGIAAISVWMDGSGFTSAANSIGATGYVFLETQEIDIGDLDDERQAIFSNLHGRDVKFDITPNTFAKDGGIVSTTMTVSVQQDGNLVDKTIQFQTDDCRGVSLASNPLSFTVELLQMERAVAMADDGSVMSDDAVATIAADAPASSGDTTTSAAA